ncbi:hypothetical protein CC79DRAFT_150792 [Sarocladium strictum]
MVHKRGRPGPVFLHCSPVPTKLVTSKFTTSNRQFKSLQISKMIKVLSCLALVACANLPFTSAKPEEAKPTEKPKPINSKYWHELDFTLVAIDPATADTVDDAVYNCVHDFAQYEPRWACNPTNQIVGPYATMCTPDGSPSRLRKQLYKYCANRDAGRDGRKPYLKKIVSGKGTTIIKTGTQVPAKAAATIGAPIVVVGGNSADANASSGATKTTTKTASVTNKSGSSAGLASQTKSSAEATTATSSGDPGKVGTIVDDSASTITVDNDRTSVATETTNQKTAMIAGAVIESPPERPVNSKIDDLPEASDSAMHNDDNDGTSRTTTNTERLETGKGNAAEAATPSQSGKPSKVSSVVGASPGVVYNINVEGGTQTSNLMVTPTPQIINTNGTASRTSAAASTQTAAGASVSTLPGKPAIVANVVGASTSMIHNINVEIDGEVDGDVEIEIEINGQGATTMNQTAKHTVMVLAVSKTTVTDISTVTGTKTITGIGFVPGTAAATGTRVVSKSLAGETKFRTVFIRPITVENVGYDDRDQYADEYTEDYVDEYTDGHADDYDCWEECEEGEEECFESCWEEHKR